MSFITRPLQNFAEWVVHPGRKHCFNLNEGGEDEIDLLGVKGASLCELYRMSIPVPPAFIISTEFSLEFQRDSLGGEFPDHLDELNRHIKHLEEKSGRSFGYTPGKCPLLLSVRGASAVQLPQWKSANLVASPLELLGLPESYSMPGMSDTILNIGINEDIVNQLVKEIGPRFAYDTYSRFLMDFGVIVLGEDPAKYSKVLEDVANRLGDKKILVNRSLLMLADYQQIIKEFKAIREVPNDPIEQLVLTIKGLLRNWFSRSAMQLREAMDIPRATGMAIIVQSMVFGNINRQSGTGICFSRNPTTGDTGIVAQFLSNAEGEDLIRSTRHSVDFPKFEIIMPTVAKKLREYCQALETKRKETQTIEFAVQNGEVFILQARVSIQSPVASVKMAVSMVQSGHLTEREALMKLNARQMNYFLDKQIDPSIDCSLQTIATGMPGGYGVVTGHIAFSAAMVEEFVQKGAKAVFCITGSVSKEELLAIKSAAAVITISGTMHSDVAVLCRGLGKPCITGVKSLPFISRDDILEEEKVDPLLEDSKQVKKQCVHPASLELESVLCEGDVVSVDGSLGKLLLGSPPTVNATMNSYFQTVIEWTEKFQKMKVFVNIHSYDDVFAASGNDFDGVGCLSTDFLIRGVDASAKLLKSFFLTDSIEERGKVSDMLLQFLTEDIRKVLEVFDGKKVVIKLFDTILQDIIPVCESGDVELATLMNYSVSHVKSKLNAIRCENPIVGLRGCRLFMKFPELLSIQVQAIVNATIQLAKEKGINVFPDLAVPYVSSDHELEALLPIIRKNIGERHSGNLLGYHQNALLFNIGVVVSTPRGCLRAAAIAPLVDFVCFDTKDLTELTYGCSKDDHFKFMNLYLRDHIAETDPFEQFDERGVGVIMRNGIEKFREWNTSINLTVSSDSYGNDLRSIQFFQKLGVDIISCNVKQAPIAKLVSAQANIQSMSSKYSKFLPSDIVWLMEGSPEEKWASGVIF